MKNLKLSFIIFLGLLVVTACSGKNEESQTENSAPASSAAITYDAALSEGIQFQKPDYPSFIKSAKGFSVPENWGRWSDGKNVVLTFKNPLPEKFKLEIKGTVLPSNAGKPILVEVGKWSGHIEMTAEPLNKSKLYEITVLNSSMADEIQITVPNPEPPGNGDPRNLGIGFVSLRIVTEK